MSTTTTTLDGLSTGTWNIDPAHSALGFQVRHMMVSKVRGKFDEFTATLTVGESLEDSSVAAEVTMASINTGVADRDNHLRTNDFFEVETYPTMTFRSTKLTPTELTGDLTIKNVTKPVTFDVELGGIAPTRTATPAPGSRPPSRSTARSSASTSRCRCRVAASSSATRSRSPSTWSS